MFSIRILGRNMNCDAYHMTDPRSDGLRVSSCISKSLEDAGVAPEEVSICLEHEFANDLLKIPIHNPESEMV
jgi:3-oxoacyl-(acyl-carrier-protein) synthase